MKIKVKSKMLKKGTDNAVVGMQDEKGKIVSQTVPNPKKSSALFGKQPQALPGVKPKLNIPKSLTP